MRWSLLLLLVGCGSPQVRDIAFPAVAIDADGAVCGYLDVRSLTATNRQAIERYHGLRVLDSNGREYVVRAVKEIDPPGMFSDFAGTKPFQVEIAFERGRRMAPSAVVTRIAPARARTGGSKNWPVAASDDGVSKRLSVVGCPSCGKTKVSTTTFV